jgi:hypothetical protein
MGRRNGSRSSATECAANKTHSLSAITDFLGAELSSFRGYRSGLADGYPSDDYQATNMLTDKGHLVAPMFAIRSRFGRENVTGDMVQNVERLT